MKVLFLISHPAHYHLFKNFIISLHQRGHKTTILVRPKDVLENLMASSGFKYTKVSDKERGAGRFSMILSLLKRVIFVTKIARRFKPDFLIGSDSTLAFVGKILRIDSFEFSEDDESVIKLYAKISYPLYSCIISPSNCQAGKWEYKKIGYDGYHELAFLSEKCFVPRKDILRQYNLLEPYCIIRLSRLNAHHDNGIKGINEEFIRKLINYLENHFTIYITSEKRLNNEFEKHRLLINPKDIHHILSFSELLISDSQSMSMEAAWKSMKG